MKTLRIVLEPREERRMYQFSRFGEKSNFLSNKEDSSETRVFTWLDVVRKMMRSKVVSEIVTDERKVI
jgi:hypothetical protein